MKLGGEDIRTNHVYDTRPYDQQRELDLGMLLFTILASVLGCKNNRYPGQTKRTHIKS